MENPIYKFELTATYGETVSTRTVHPIYKSDLAIDWQIEQNEQYYRGKLSGKLNFIAADYDWIVGKNFETEFELRIYISYNSGASWSQYWTGRFWKTDCEFDADNKKITVTPSVYDAYNAVVAGLEKEYNLVELAPEIKYVHIDKRPLIQVYSPGESVIACFLSGMYWEQDAEEVSDEDDLTDVYHFSLLSQIRRVEVSGANISDVNGLYWDKVDLSGQYLPYSYTKGDYEFKYTVTSLSQTQEFEWAIVRVSDNVKMWSYTRQQQAHPTEPLNLILSPVAGSGATGTVNAYIALRKVFGRYLLDVETLGRVQTSPIPADDIVENNRNYSRCCGYAVSGTIVYSTRFSSTPTKYGLYQPGQYYQVPYYPFEMPPILYPVAKTTWSEISVWFAFDELDWVAEQAGRKSYVLKDAFPLSSVISVLLNQFAPDVKHEALPKYSQFLYGSSDPITNVSFSLFLTQKSNILAGTYDQPAQKAPATLKSILDMLRDCFRLYWFIELDENGDYIFRIEHIKYFLNGGSYSGTPVVGTDLTALEVTRNGKPWAFGTSQYSYDKLEMPERYQFTWMDDVTDLFEGNPIDIESKYVSEGNIEEISVTNFTSDIDYMLLNPDACDEDGFALLAPVGNSNAVIGGATEEFTLDDGEYEDIDVISELFTEPSTEATAEIKVNFAAEYPDAEIVINYYKDGELLANSDTWVGISEGESRYDIHVEPGTDTIRFTMDSGGPVTFSVLSVRPFNGEKIYTLPYVNFRDDSHYSDRWIQNAYLAFYWLQQYYMQDMPASLVSGEFYGTNGPSIFSASGLKKQKTQEVQYPVFTDPNLYQLVKTGIGNGQIEKISINLSARTAKTTLRYDTE